MQRTKSKKYIKMFQKVPKLFKSNRKYTKNFKNLPKYQKVQEVQKRVNNNQKRKKSSKI